MRAEGPLLTAEASVVVQGVSPEQLWEFVYDPYSAVLWKPHMFVEARRVEDTGPGVGEQQRAVVRDASGTETVVLTEVTVFEEGRYAAFVHRTEPPSASSGGDVLLEASTDGLSFTSSQWVLPGGLSDAEASTAREQLGETNREYVLWVKAYLESHR